MEAARRGYSGTADRRRWRLSDGSDIAIFVRGPRGAALIRRLTGQMGRQVVGTFGSRVLGTLLAFAASAVVARSLGPAGRGAFGTVAALASMGVMFGNLGLASSNTYFVSRDRSLVPQVVANSLVVSVGLGLSAAAALAFGALWSGTGPSVGYAALAIGLAGVPVSIAYLLLVNILLARLQVLSFNLIQLGVRVAGVAFALAVVLAASHSGPAPYLGAGVLAQVVALSATYLRLGIPVRTLLKSASLHLLKLHIPYAFRAYISAFLAFMLLRSDILIVQRLSGNSEVGNYSIAVSMADAIMLLPTSFGLLLFPRLAADEDPASRRRTTRRFIFLVALLMGAIVAAAVPLAGPAIRIVFGQAYSPAARMFFLLCVAVALLGVNTILSNHMAAEGMPWAAVWVWGGALLVNVGLNFVWVPALGGNGAALASIVGYGVVLVAQSWIVFGRRSPNVV